MKKLARSKRPREFVDWTAHDAQLGVITDAALAEIIGCTDTCVRDRRVKLGIASKFKTHWTSNEESEYQRLLSDSQIRCRRCREIKGVEFFDRASSKKSGRDGRQRWCKQCRAAYQSQRVAERRAYWLPLAGGCCQNCGFLTYSTCLDFHHIDPANKGAEPGAMIMSRPVGAADLHAELDKCALICSNCHMAIHRGAVILPWKKRDGLGWTVNR